MAVHAVADQVTAEQLKLGMLFPPQYELASIKGSGSSDRRCVGVGQGTEADPRLRSPAARPEGAQGEYLSDGVATQGLHQCQSVISDFAPGQQLAKQQFDLGGRVPELRIAKHPKQFQGGGLGQHRREPAALPAMADPGQAAFLKEQCRHQHVGVEHHSDHC